MSSDVALSHCFSQSEGDANRVRLSPFTFDHNFCIFRDEFSEEELTLAAQAKEEFQPYVQAAKTHKQ